MNVSLPEQNQLLIITFVPHRLFYTKNKHTDPTE